MPKNVPIKGLGVVAFPDSMPDHEIQWHVDEHLGTPKVDRIRGMADLPLTGAGVKEIKGLSQKLGPFDTIFTNDLKRAQQTAKLLRPKRIVTDTHLRPMNYGNFTGHPSKEAAIPMHALIKVEPGKKLPGGDSFAGWSRRLAMGIHHVQEYVKQHPDEKVGVVMNRSSMQLYKTLLKGGNIDEALAYSPDEKTGSAFRRDGNELKPVDKADGPGEYVFRHGKTPWNGNDEAQNAAS